jgi:hypothetical protein
LTVAVTLKEEEEEEEEETYSMIPRSCCGAWHLSGTRYFLP